MKKKYIYLLGMSMLVLSLFSVAFAAEYTPYLHEAKYIQENARIISWQVVCDEHFVTYQDSEQPFAENNILYLPLISTLNACGVEAGRIQQDAGEITILFGDQALSIHLGQDTWMLGHGKPRQTTNGYVREENGVIYVPKEMLCEWQHALPDSALDKLSITAGYDYNNAGYATYYR